jgi:hypothetical protein
MKIGNPIFRTQTTHTDRASDEANASAILSIKSRTRLGWACVPGFTVLGCAQRNGETNSARVTADKDGLASQRPIHGHSLR